MLIYSPDINPRLKYTLDFVFRDVLNIDIRITNIKEELNNHDGAKLNYSAEKIEGIPFLEATKLLFEDGLTPQDNNLLESLDWEGLPAFFPVKQESMVPFDLFSSVFFLISRYEEYLPFDPDQHNRFQSKLSLAAKLDFLDKPIVDLWINKLGKILEAFFPDEIKITKPKFIFEPTIDIDNAWAFKHKGFFRTLGSVFSPGQRMERRNFRYQVLRGKQHDPFYQFEKMQMIHEKAGFEPIFFFLVGPYGKFDKNISPSKKAFRSLIKQITGKYQTGLHPSYSSDFNQDAIAMEKKVLGDISGQKINISRQHYLRLRFPHTYRALIRAEIFNDYSMAYADKSGFRASTSHSFYFFDLESNKATELRVFPFQVMDTGLRDYEHMDPEQAIERIRNLMDSTKEAGGTFRSLWHNESFSEWQGWEGWTKVYKEMLKLAGDRSNF